VEDRNDCKVVKLSERVGGAGAAQRTHLRRGRYETSTVGFDQYTQLTGSDPWGTPNFTGLIVPESPTLTPQTRYLGLLARHSFNSPECAYLRGVRLYTSLFGFLGDDSGPYELEITSPLWRFAFGGGNITFHVMVRGRGFRDRRNPANAPSFSFEDATGPAWLYQSLAPTYVPPNAGRPWGTPLPNTDFGTIYDAGRHKWRSDQAERSMRVPIPAPCDLLLFASVWQHDPGVGETQNRPTFTTAQAAAASPEDRFWAEFDFVQFGRVAGALIVEEEEAK
jgi:hypothetical protein